MQYPTLRVTTPDGQVREYPLDTSPVVIGRAESSRVVIDHVSVSRRHARMVLDGNQVSLEDLGSAIGTFVDGVPLAAGEARPVRPGEELRFGDAIAVLVVPVPGPVVVAPVPLPSVATPESVVVAPVVAPMPADARPHVPTDQSVTISLTSPGAPVAAGATTTATCIIGNRGDEPDRLAISVDGLPDGWSRVTRPSLDLPPDGRDEVTIVLQPPRSPKARAGEHSFAVSARSELRGIEVRALGKLVVLPYGGHTVELTPVRSSAVFKLTVSNAGNAPAAVVVSGRARGDVGLSFILTPTSLELEPGQSGTTRVRVRAARGQFFGKERILPFELEAASGSSAVSAVGELRSRPGWLTLRWIVLAGAVAAAAVGGFFAYQSFAGDDDKPGTLPAATTVANSATRTTAAPSSAATGASTRSASSTATAATATPTAATVAATPGPTNLPSVTPPSVQSRLGSGTRAQVIAATSLLAEPTGGARVLQPLKVGDRLIVVTNTPASGTFVITEGLVFWRVLVEGTQTVGWVVEVTVAGDRRFLDLVR